jgi:hypothetical protein
MHPKLLEATVRRCREYIEAGDCHGEPPPVERLIEAVQQLADQLAAIGVEASRPKCERCDDTGDVHDATGEWRGRCTCPAGVTVLDADTKGRSGTDDA